MEQLNIVGKRSGEGIVTHRATMVNVLSRGIADRLLLMDFTIGRKGLLNYVKSLAGSNVIKIVPATNGGVSDEQADVKARLKVVCGSFQSYLDDNAWIGEKTGHSVAEVRFCPANTITPNIGSNELADAIGKVLPFTNTEEARPVLQCVLFTAANGKLRLSAADGFRLAECTLDYEAANGDAVKVLVNRSSLKAIPAALRKAKRVKVWYGKAGDALDGMALFIDTEIARYRFVSEGGEYPDYERVIPTEFSCHAHLDTQEALKAVNWLRAVADNPKDFAVDMTVGEGQIVMANVDDKGDATVKADGDGAAFIRLNGAYLASVMRAFGGMVDMSLAQSYSPILFTSNGLRAVVMPLMSQKSTAQQRADAEAKGEHTEPEAEPAEAELDGEEPEAELEAVLDGEEPEPTNGKPKRRGRQRKAVAVA